MTMREIHCSADQVADAVLALINSRPHRARRRRPSQRGQVRRQDGIALDLVHHDPHELFIRHAVRWTQGAEHP
jgi:hypothetical protein